MSFYPNHSPFASFPQPIQTRPTSTPGVIPGVSNVSSAADINTTDYPPGAMNYINLNIDEYRMADLEAFFTLPTKNYDIQDVVHKKKSMCSAVDRDSTLNAATRASIHTFLDQASRAYCPASSAYRKRKADNCSSAKHAERRQRSFYH